MTTEERNAVLEEAAQVLDRRAETEARNSNHHKACARDYKAREAAHVARIARQDAAAIRALKEPTTTEERGLRKQGSSKWGPQFPPSSCTSWEDCVSDGDCHDPNCGASSQNGGDEEPTT